MANLRKILSLVLCVVMLVCCFAGCSKNGTESSTSTGTSSVSQVGNIVGLGGAGMGSKFALQSPSGKYWYTNTVSVEWSGLKDGETVSLKIEKKNGDKYTTLLEKTGLTGTTFKTNDKIENGIVYRLTAKAVAKDGTERVAANTTNGLEITALNLTKNTSVNAGMDFAFNGKISESVLNNYLSRAITYTITDENKEDAARAILNVGAKLICRTVADWYPSTTHEAKLPEYTAIMDQIHAVDPDVVFEACIFETCGPEMNNIVIPKHVLKAFGKNEEERNFNYKKMLFVDGHTNAQWDATHGVPDITREETQMFIYYRACFYIDNGFESLHLGQTGFMGENDPTRKAWTKVIHMIRDYAKTHARRKYVFIDCHYPGRNFVGTDGVMLADFNMWPLRLTASRKAGDPASPQKCVLDLKVDTPYKNAVSGKSPSGWTTNNYPFLLEFDNYDPKSGHAVYYYDEISWIASQPDSYRRSFFTEVRKMVSNIDKRGHVALPGSRTTSSAKNFSWYNMNNKNYCNNGFSDEDAIISAFKAYK
ncbi:MAG: hypothetical protein IJX79_05845 [Clostridia bacterium]|nr:hypothetical protein [Clostridia bacterium]MBQ8304444.1 hypothetical protein [Clostridia bacterium]